MTASKNVLKCETRYCRNTCEDKSEYCPRCRVIYDVDAIANPPRQLISCYEYACLFCRYRDDTLRMKDKLAVKLVKSGWLRCPECGSAGITLTRQDSGRIGILTGARVGGRHANIGARANEWSMAV